jgi:predicted MPP superfamily phosphohydrolase
MLDRLEKMCDELKWALRAADNKKDIEILRETKACLRAAYELFYNFENNKYADYQYKTYELLKKGGKKKKGFNPHWGNLMRILNSLLADVFMLKYSAD